MASDAEWSLGDFIEIGDGATPTEIFTRIPEVRNITFNRGTRTRVDTSSHDSTKPYRDNVPTFFEGGQLVLDGNYLPNNSIQQMVEDRSESDLATNFKVKIEDGAGQVVWSGKGFVTSFNPTMNFDDARRFAATIDLTGQWVRS
jgi:hypothetical protein